MAACLLLGPVFGAPTRRVLGSSDSEGPGHLWRFAAHLRALPHSGPWIRPFEAGTLRPGEAEIRAGQSVTITCHAAFARCVSG